VVVVVVVVAAVAAAAAVVVVVVVKGSATRLRGRHPNFGLCVGRQGSVSAS